MVQFEPMYDTIGDLIYPEPELPMDGSVYVVKSSTRLASYQFRGTIKRKVFNKLNGRWSYQLEIDRRHDKTKVHDDTYFAADDLLKVSFLT